MELNRPERNWSNRKTCWIILIPLTLHTTLPPSYPSPPKVMNINPVWAICWLCTFIGPESVWHSYSVIPLYAGGKSYNSQILYYHGEMGRGKGIRRGGELSLAKELKGTLVTYVLYSPFLLFLGSFTVIRHNLAFHIRHIHLYIRHIHLYIRHIHLYICHIHLYIRHNYLLFAIFILISAISIFLFAIFIFLSAIFILMYAKFL